jgi:hypothetical protein
MNCWKRLELEGLPDVEEMEPVRIGCQLALQFLLGDDSRHRRGPSSM